MQNDIVLGSPPAHTPYKYDVYVAHDARTTRGWRRRLERLYYYVNIVSVTGTCDAHRGKRDRLPLKYKCLSAGHLGAINVAYTVRAAATVPGDYPADRRTREPRRRPRADARRGR